MNENKVTCMMYHLSVPIQTFQNEDLPCFHSPLCVYSEHEMDDGDDVANAKNKKTILKSQTKSGVGDKISPSNCSEAGITHSPPLVCIMQ